MLENFYAIAPVPMQLRLYNDGQVIFIVMVVFMVAVTVTISIDRSILAFLSPLVFVLHFGKVLIV